MLSKEDMKDIYTMYDFVLLISCVEYAMNNHREFEKKYEVKEKELVGLYGKVIDTLDCFGEGRVN